MGHVEVLMTVEEWDGKSVSGLVESAGGLEPDVEELARLCLARDHRRR